MAYFASVSWLHYRFHFQPVVTSGNGMLLISHYTALVHVRGMDWCGNRDKCSWETSWNSSWMTALEFLPVDPVGVEWLIFPGMRSKARDGDFQILGGLLTSSCFKHLVIPIAYLTMNKNKRISFKEIIDIVAASFS